MGRTSTKQSHALRARKKPDALSPAALPHPPAREGKEEFAARAFRVSLLRARARHTPLPLGTSSRIAPQSGGGMVTFAAHCDLNPRTHSATAERGTLASHGVVHAKTNTMHVAFDRRCHGERLGNRARAGKPCGAGRHVPEGARRRRAARKALVLPHRAALDAQMLVPRREGADGHAARGGTNRAAG